MQHDSEALNKKSAIGFVDTPLNLSKPKSAEDVPKSIKNMSNDGNNNSKNHSIDHIASGSKIMTNHPPRLPYNLSFNSDESDLFAACRLWPVMAAAAQHHHNNNSTSQSNNLTSMVTGTRDFISENNFANFSQAMTETKNKRGGGDQIGISQLNVSEDKVRMVRQQGRGRNNAVDRDLLGKQ